MYHVNLHDERRRDDAKLFFEDSPPGGDKKQETATREGKPRVYMQRSGMWAE